MKSNIKVGNYVYRPYSRTYWLITEMYYKEMPIIYSRADASISSELCVTAVKVLDKRLTSPTIKPKIIRDIPVGCFTLLTPKWYAEHHYFEKKGVLWDLICTNSAGLFGKRRVSGLTCPCCKSKFTYTGTLASNPPQFEFNCGRCDYGLRYYERTTSQNPITQGELDEDFKIKGSV